MYRMNVNNKLGSFELVKSRDTGHYLESSHTLEWNDFLHILAVLFEGRYGAETEESRDSNIIQCKGTKSNYT